MCNGANNKCFACGIAGHFAKNCKNIKKSKKKGKKIKIHVIVQHHISHLIENLNAF